MGRDGKKGEFALERLFFTSSPIPYGSLSPPLHEEAVSQCSGAIHRTQYVMSDKSDRYSMLYDNFKKQDYDTVCQWGGMMGR